MQLTSLPENSGSTLTARRRLCEISHKTIGFEHIVAGSSYFVLVRNVFASNEVKLVGPFVVLKKLGKVPGMLPTSGWSQLQAEMLRDGKTQELIVPTGGDSLSLDQRFTLHESNSEYFWFFELLRLSRCSDHSALLQ